MAGWAAVGIATAAFEYNARMGQEQKSKQKQALRRQEKVQGIAEQKAASDARRAEEASNRARAQQPNLGQITAAQAAQSALTAGNTTLTGPQGVDPQRLKLGRRTLLGG